MKKKITTYFLAPMLVLSIQLFGQENEVFKDAVYAENIKSALIYIEPLVLTDPVIPLNGINQLHLKFDDLDGDRKDYYYTIMQCNIDWTASELQTYDYLKGFASQDIRDSRFSFNTDQAYTHFDVLFPNQDISITKSGNYIVKVFLDNDLDKVVLIKRFIVVDSKVKIASNVQRSGTPHDQENTQTIDFSINYHGLEISNPLSEVKTLLMQNFRWDNALAELKPQFVKTEQLEYFSDIDNSFLAGKEFRNFDTRTLKYQTERVASITETKNTYTVNLMPDEVRYNQQYFYRKDINGKYFPGILDYFDQDAQPDYVYVHFSMPVDYPIKGGKIYLMGAFTDWQLKNDFLMHYNSATSAYEATLYLKQGFYEYIYYFDTGENNNKESMILEGSDSEAENTYQVFVYYRPFGSRYDQVIGYVSTNTYNH